MVVPYKRSQSRYTAKMIGEAQIIVSSHSAFYRTSSRVRSQKPELYLHPTTTMPADVDYLKGLLRSYPDYPKKVRHNSRRASYF